MLNWVSRAVLISMIVLMLLAPAAAQDDFEPSEALLAQLDRIEAFTEEQRGLTMTTPIDRRFPNRDELLMFLQAQVSEPDAAESLQKSVQFYAAFDFMDPNTDLTTLYLNLMRDQVAGYYDNDTKEMNTITLNGQRPQDRIELLEQSIYVHEYTHALQDANFDLSRLLPDDTAAPDFNVDALQAHLSLVEGDATLMLQRFVMYVTEQNPMAAVNILFSSAALPGGGQVPADTPPILAAELISPYLDGLNFVLALYDEGGWDAVNAAYDNLPASTEQILHPDKYLAGELPVDVELRTSADVLGEGWELYYDRPLGEFYLRQYLGTQLGGGTVDEAATGWGGDRFHLFYNADENQRAWVMRLVWDTPQDSEEAMAAFEAFGAARYGVERGQNGCWSNETDSMCLLLEADGSIMISLAPLFGQAQLLIVNQTAMAQ